MASPQDTHQQNPAPPGSGNPSCANDPAGARLSCDKTIRDCQRLGNDRRFGGYWPDSMCHYVLGDENCKLDMAGFPGGTPACKAGGVGSTPTPVFKNGESFSIQHRYTMDLGGSLSDEEILSLWEIASTWGPIRDTDKKKKTEAAKSLAEVALDGYCACTGKPHVKHGQHCRIDPEFEEPGVIT